PQLANQDRFHTVRISSYLRLADIRRMVYKHIVGQTLGLRCQMECKPNKFRNAGLLSSVVHLLVGCLRHLSGTIIVSRAGDRTRQLNNAGAATFIKLMGKHVPGEGQTWRCECGGVGRHRVSDREKGHTLCAIVCDLRGAKAVTQCEPVAQLSVQRMIAFPVYQSPNSSLFRRLKLLRSAGPRKDTNYAFGVGGVRWRCVSVVCSRWRNESTEVRTHTIGVKLPPLAHGEQLIFIRRWAGRMVGYDGTCGLTCIGYYGDGAATLLRYLSKKL
ncbi:hypothetical protein Bbelb_446490, partial [Branchiostoma belcheri]